MSFLQYFNPRQEGEHLVLEARGKRQMEMKDE